MTMTLYKFCGDMDFPSASGAGHLAAHALGITAGHSAGNLRDPHQEGLKEAL